MSPTEVAREEDVVADPDDEGTIEAIGAAYEAWVADTGYDPATTDMAGGELEENPWRSTLNRRTRLSRSGRIVAVG